MFRQFREIHLLAITMPPCMKNNDGKQKKKKTVKTSKEKNSLDQLKKSLKHQKQALTKIIKNIQHEKYSKE